MEWNSFSLFKCEILHKIDVAVAATGRCALKMGDAPILVNCRSGSIKLNCKEVISTFTCVTH